MERVARGREQLHQEHARKWIGTGIGSARKGIALERLGRPVDAVFVYQLGIMNGIEVEPSLKAALTKGLTRAKKQAEGQQGRV
jgi:hypothetical protein